MNCKLVRVEIFSIDSGSGWVDRVCRAVTHAAPNYTAVEHAVHGWACDPTHEVGTGRYVAQYTNEYGLTQSYVFRVEHEIQVNVHVFID